MMLGLEEVRAVFSEYEDLTPLEVCSGQKDVFSAKQGDRKVAVKLIKPTDQDHDRTVREIEAVARLRSDYVPSVLDHGTRVMAGESRIFLVEDFIDGGSCRAYLDDCPRPELRFILDLATALLAACRDFEQAELVHRDIKPANIMVGLDGKIWVIDFGIVRLLDQESLTATSAHFGLCTPGYGAPEQVRNLKPQIDARADLYSIGIVLYETFFGMNPHLVGQHDVLGVIRAVQQNDLPRLDGIDPELAEFIAALTSRFPSRRPRNSRDAWEWFVPIRDRLLNVS